MVWCEQNSVEYIFGLARNSRLEALLSPAMAAVRRHYELLGIPVRTFMELSYQTNNSWSRSRRVVGKAEHLDKGENPRFVVTSYSAQRFGACALYDGEYCARGDMENRIKEQQLDLFADRTSTATMKANQMRLWMSTIAYCLINDLRKYGLKGTKMARATCGTIRLRLLKIGALIKTSVRRVVVHLATGCPFQEIFATALRNLQLCLAETS